MKDAIGDAAEAAEMSSNVGRVLRSVTRPSYAGDQKDRRVEAIRGAMRRGWCDRGAIECDAGVQCRPSRALGPRGSVCLVVHQWVPEMRQARGNLMASTRPIKPTSMASNCSALGLVCAGRINSQRHTLLFCLSSSLVRLCFLTRKEQLKSTTGANQVSPRPSRSFRRTRRDHRHGPGAVAPELVAIWRPRGSPVPRSRRWQSPASGNSLQASNCSRSQVSPRDVHPCFWFYTVPPCGFVQHQPLAIVVQDRGFGHGRLQVVPTTPRRSSHQRCTGAAGSRIARNAQPQVQQGNAIAGTGTKASGMDDVDQESRKRCTTAPPQLRRGVRDAAQPNQLFQIEHG